MGEDPRRGSWERSKEGEALIAYDTMNDEAKKANTSPHSQTFQWSTSLLGERSNREPPGGQRA